MAGQSRRPSAAMLLYPSLTLLDLVGPLEVFTSFFDVHLVWRTTEPVVSDSGVRVTPTTTFADCPRDVDVLFVPGGRRQDEHMDAPDVLAFLADRGERARYVTSVCGGALVLGAAGLLVGYRAATHWTGREVLPLFGAENVNERVVVDRNRITGGGVTAGLDFALSVVAEMFGEQAARTVQLALEYDPQPPFDAGSPEKAGPELAAAVSGMAQPLNDAITRIADDLATRGWGRARTAPQPAGAAPR